VINKNVFEDDLKRAVNVAFDAGKTQVKLYFMNGLPTETDEDLKGIADLAHGVVEEYYHNPNRMKGRSPQVTISVACFVPKPFTAFQWEPQDTVDTLNEKLRYLGTCVTDRKVRYTHHVPYTSHIEAVLARGDRRLGKALEIACGEGFHFDAWDEHFSYERWLSVIEKAGLDPAFYANRRRSYDEVLPWDIIDCGVTKEFLIREHKNAMAGVTTPSCREKCSGCGANSLGGERSCCPKK
ncbi:MAG: B12-binding domain-containing radical SAM protein, partial [Clostridia bacterium]|nr:B12-binding domain-containing radical SAM protein [Clostridia bacterium]